MDTFYRSNKRRRIGASIHLHFDVQNAQILDEQA